MVARRGYQGDTKGIPGYLPLPPLCAGGETRKPRDCKVRSKRILRRGVGMAQVIHGEFGPSDASLASVEMAETIALRPQKTHSVAALNLSPKSGDVGGNLLLAERAIVEAKLAHPDLGWVVLPELFTSGYSDLAAIHRYAEDAEDGASVGFFSCLAGRLGLYIAYGFPERVPGTAGAAGVAGVCDSANLVGPDGVVL